MPCSGADCKHPGWTAARSFVLRLLRSVFPLGKRLKAEWRIEKLKNNWTAQGNEKATQWEKLDPVNDNISSTYTEAGLQPQRLSFLQMNKISSPISIRLCELRHQLYQLLHYQLYPPHSPWGGGLAFKVVVITL